MYYHNHNYFGVTSLNDGHAHEYTGESSYAPCRRGHIHYIQGVTTFEDGHAHTYGISTSVPFYLPGRGHVHFIRPIARVKDRHIHFIRNFTKMN